MPEVYEPPPAVPEVQEESNLVIGNDLGIEALDFDSLDIGGTMNINEDE